MVGKDLFVNNVINNSVEGCDCFDFSKSLNLLVTGSSDHMVRLWNPYVSSKVVSVLEGHATGILDVRIHEGLKQVFSFSHDAVSEQAEHTVSCCVSSVHKIVEQELCLCRCSSPGTSVITCVFRLCHSSFHPAC